MNGPPGKSRWLFALFAATVAAGVGYAIWLNTRNEEPPPTPGPPAAPTTFPLPGYSESRHLNTGPDAKYIGVDACAECHRGNHRSYLLTAHSRALADLDPNAEPPDGSFHHATSGRSYRVYRQGGQLRHEELLRTADGKEIARVDLPIRYLIGSGNFCRSYLVEVDGFLHESPLTWYTAKKKWDMSPGYDFPYHWSFERRINLACLACHAGRVELTGEAVHRLTIHEKSIGCESCHGPGSRHAEFQRSGKHAAGQEDLTIVHPGKLPRPRLEAVCATCHLGPAAGIHVRGRWVTDFRPGMPLTDYRIDYRFDADRDQMTVTGHIEQLRLSACYQKSTDLTCLTCHDPHAKSKPADPVAFYRRKCLDCHSVKACAIEQSERLKKSAADNCVTCHMPRGDTDIPHIAFTHHRIGKHTKQPAALPQRVPELVPSVDDSHLPAIDRQRNLGLAYYEICEKPEHEIHAEVYWERARSLLDAAHAAGLRDGVTAQALAGIYWHRQDPVRAGAFAREALQAKDLPANLRAEAMMLLANCHVAARDLKAAVGVLEELVKIRRFSDDWRLLGLCYLDLNEPKKGLQALHQALAIRPTRADVHGETAAAYRRLGDLDRAREHRDKAQWLLQNKQH